MTKHDALKENLYNFYTANKHLSRKEIFDRFIAIGAPERSLKRWLYNLEQNKTLKRKKGSGRIAKKSKLSKENSTIVLVVHKERQLMRSF